MPNFVVLLGALVAFPAFAQSSAALEPLAKAGGSSSLAYRSAFADYRPWSEAETLAWRTANDDAAALGGHMGQVRGNVDRPQREATNPAPAPPKTGPAK